jgi:5-formyltetrahydrofolate cyclo-ligase
LISGTSANSQLRKSALRARRALTDEQRDNASSTISGNVIRSREFFASKSIACYLPCNDEVDTTRIIERAWRAKKRIFVPVIDSRGEMIFRQLASDTDLYRNYFGIWEPASGDLISPKSIDMVITPLVAFDNKLHRIGMGGGYYDRCFQFLKHRRKWVRPKLVGVAFDCQKVEKITPNPWDIPLYQVVTEKNA